MRVNNCDWNFIDNNVLSKHSNSLYEGGIKKMSQSRQGGKSERKGKKSNF
jgi:hypothetical protein